MGLRRDLKYIVFTFSSFDGLEARSQVHRFHFFQL